MDALRMPAHTPDDERPMRREHAFYSSWCRLFDFHLRRLGLSAVKFAERANRSQQAIHSYLVGRARPPLDQVPVWAAMLGLRGEEKERFVSAAMEAHVPPPVWLRIRELEKALAARAVPLTPTAEALRDQLLICQANVRELVQLLTEIEGLFYTRTVPVDRVSFVREQIGSAVRRSIERYARA